VFCLDLCTGGGGFSAASGAVLWKLRVPRVLTALTAGASLALAGAQMQGIFRNPLADPHIMGVSGGAGLGAALAALAVGTASGWAGGLPLALSAFAGALLTAGLIVAVSSRVRATTTLLIFGVLLGFIFSAVSSILQYSAREESLKLFYSWMAGSFSGTRYGEVAGMAGALLIGAALAFRDGKGLDIILFGDDFAELSGASIRAVRIRSMLGASLIAASVTAFCGPVGFVGIVAPHLARRIGGTSVHRKVLPLSMLTGAFLALCADILANLWKVPLPAGSTMALIGIPFILVILLRNRL